MPICPNKDCGAEMVKRLARRGKNKGKFFYGCSNYPSCKEIINIDDSADNNINENYIDYKEDYFNQEVKIPVFLQAREKFENYQVRFYESLAVSADLLEKINYQEIDRDKISFYNKWRLDYPILSNVIDEDFKLVLLIAHKILNRGRLTLISPTIENKLEDYFKVKNSDVKNFDISKYNNLAQLKEDSNIWFDGGGTEKLFYNKILPKILGPYYRKYVIPQVSFSSLISSNDNNDPSVFRRVDFFINTENKKVIVEIDGVEHKSHKNRDDERDDILRQSGYEVIRIKNDEVINNLGPNIEKLYDIFKNDDFIKSKPKLSNIEKYYLSLKLSHQLQITIIEAFLSGHININDNNFIYFDYNSVILNKPEINELIKIVEKDLKELIYNLNSLYQININIDNFKILLFDSNYDKKNSIVITYNENLKSEISKFIIQDISFNNQISHYSRSSNVKQIKNIKIENLEFFLYYIFRFNKFLEGQVEAITRALNGNDAIILLPTGSGKSLAFQLASMLLSGVTIVIDPILSLINDQIDNLERIGIDRVIGITSQISDPKLKSKIISAFGQGEYIFCYIAPERLQTKEFRQTIKDLTISTPISLIVIDEAHCVSEWGHDFRTSYLNVGRITRDYCKSNNRIPPLLALTGTASNSVLKDVKRELDIDDFEAIITPKTFDRKELRYSVFESLSSEKFNILKGYLQRKLPEKFNLSSSSFYQLNGKNTKCGLIFYPHVGGDFGTIENASKITNELGIFTKYYGGKSPKGWNNEKWSKYKLMTEKEFKNNKFSLLSATKAFGMGIDKKNIRYTIHFGIPNSVESFYQEAGRAGRDRENAECVILISNDDKERTNNLLNPENSVEKIAEIMEKERKWENDDDITRAIWFHVNSFKGIDQELEDVNYVLNKAGDLTKFKKVNFTIERKERNSVEKGIHRLLILGVVSDYTIDYSNNEFQVQFNGTNKDEIVANYAKYVNGYNKGRVQSETSKLNKLKVNDLEVFIKKAAEILISFIYDTIEKGRRRALREMLTIAEFPFKTENNEVNADKLIRERILKYLESTYSEEIEEILSDKSAGFKNLKKLISGHETETGEVIGGLRSYKDSLELRGQVSRYLESTPDHPGLLFLRSLSEVYCKDFDENVIIQNIKAGIEFSLNRYNISKNELYLTISWIVSRIFERDKKICKKIIEELIYQINDIDLARHILKSEIDNDLLYIPSVYIFHKYSYDSLEIVK